jgi:hypothetical protein
MARIVGAWRGLPSERRLAAIGAVGLFITLFLPWYSQTGFAASTKARNLQPIYETLTGWGAFSFVEAAVLLIAIGVLALLFHRAEGRAFHLPGGDGWVITAAGLWAAFLIVWRMFDKQSAVRRGQYVFTTGIEWGIFVALLVAAFLAYAGTRIRSAHQPEPPLPGDDGIVFDGHWHAPADGSAGVAMAAASAPAAPATPATRATRAAPAAPAARGGRAASALGADAASGRAERAAARAARRRSAWRPGDQPEWSDTAEHSIGWAKRPRRNSDSAPEPVAPDVEELSTPESPATDPAAPPAAPTVESDQLTIPLESDKET